MTPDEYRALAKEYFAKAAEVLADDEQLWDRGANYVRMRVDAGLLALQLADLP